MSTQNTTRGRSLEQKTRDGTSSIGTMGAGCTGHLQSDATRNEQSAGRTDDLLSGCVDEEERDHGFQSGTQNWGHVVPSNR
ncbi:hypothetical protein AB4Z19_16900 [Pseudoduganella sp. RAF19]|jgi:hypothetical protein|uniref:hypothetical protein n=2 Tax=unclassified Pseudoduganella TaxID=2637179 RepID=UPI003F9D3993